MTPDLHVISGDFGPVPRPLVLGHEMVGIVTQVGADVAAFRIGDRVGVGPNAGSCEQCAACSAGLPVYCLTGGLSTYGGIRGDGSMTQGGFASHHRTAAAWAFRIPDALPSAATAPLLCAGITTFAPLARAGVRAGTRVAVVGVGGLGHLAIQYAAAMGARVTAISTSADKRADALAFGASAFLLLSDAAALADAAFAFDLVVNTVCARLDWPALLALLAPEGTLVQLGAPPCDLQFPADALITFGRKVVGSMTGNPREYEAMLAFSALHNICATVEEFREDEINVALAKVAKNQVKYRAVICMDEGGAAL